MTAVLDENVRGSPKSFQIIFTELNINFTTIRSDGRRAISHQDHLCDAQICPPVILFIILFQLLSCETPIHSLCIWLLMLLTFVPLSMRLLKLYLTF